MFGNLLIYQGDCQVPTLSESYRAPAEVTQTGYIFALRVVLSRLAGFLFPCRHRNITLPINERQTCLDCGATRLYFFDTDFAHADAGIFIGKWVKDNRAVRIQNARAILKKAHNLTVTLNSHPFHEGMTLEQFSAAVSAHLPKNPTIEERNGRAAILNPGADSPLFQPRQNRAVSR